MAAANLKVVGSFVVFHLFQSILKQNSVPQLLICGENDSVDLVTCSDIHSLPVEVCVLTILYRLLEEVNTEEMRDALRSSVALDDKEQRDKVEAALDTLSFSA